VKKQIIINKGNFLGLLEKAKTQLSLKEIHTEISKIKSVIVNNKLDKSGIINIDRNGDTVVFEVDVLIRELKQIEESLTAERAKYYIQRLKKGVSEIKTGKINDINMNRWKEYDEIITDSLWNIDRRDNAGAHLGWYWGNFIPQIPHQLMLRYTKKGDLVLDPFLGSGTTLIECKRLGRNGVGIELNPKVAKAAKQLIDKEPNRYNVNTDVIIGDSRKINIRGFIERDAVKSFQLIIMHPPYHDIINFSNSREDLSNATNIKMFLHMFGEVIDNTTKYLDNGRFLGIVIGDKYYKGEWIPLGFYIMNEVLNRDFKLKSIIVKNFEETRGKRNQKELWRYRALVGGFYIFKHEYILLFKKEK